MSKPQECQPGSETASLRRRHFPGFMQSLTHTWSGPLGARRACENGDPETHMHSFTQPHKSSDTAHSHPDSDPVASQSQEYCRPHQPLFSDRAGLGPGWFILRLRQKVQSLGATETRPQSDNKLGGNSQAFVRPQLGQGAKWGPAEPPPAAQLSIPRRDWFQNRHGRTLKHRGQRDGEGL